MLIGFTAMEIIHCSCCCCVSVRRARCILEKPNLCPGMSRGPRVTGLKKHMPFVMLNSARVEPVQDLASRAWSSKVTSAAFQLHFKDTSKTKGQYANSSKLLIIAGSLRGVQLSLCITMVLFVSMSLWELGSFSKHTSVCFLALMPKWINMSAALKQRAAVVHWISSSRHPSKVGQAFSHWCFSDRNSFPSILTFFHRRKT